MRYRVLSSAALMAASILWPEQGLARRVHVIKQVTQLTQGIVERPRIQQVRGELVSFVSDGDVLGPGSAHLGQREVYLWTFATDALQRATTTPGGESYDASRVTDDFRSKRQPYIAFISTGDLVPGVGNADGNPELFLWAVETGEIRQLTQTSAPVVNALPHPSDTGDCIVFESTGDLDNNDGGFGTSGPSGYSNMDGSQEVFYLDFRDNGFDNYHFTQMSNGPAGTTSSHGSVGGYFYFNQCHTLTYQSDHDQLGNGSTGTNVYEFFRQEALTKQVSLPNNLGGASIEPIMSGAGLATGGPSVVFASDANLFDNGSSGFHIYKMATLTGLLRQVTGDPAGGHRRPTVSDGSSAVFFETTGEPSDVERGTKIGPPGPHNADGNSEIVRFTGRNRVHWITRTQGCTNDYATINGNGRAAAFRTDCELVPGFNVLGQQQVMAYYEVHFREFLYQPEDCSLLQRCCSTANGCYEEVMARAYKVPRPIRD
ncbi:MAG TPA: hypothetical protein VEC57_01120 [Candidatus Limnocylindrales bacterium]|nr:hypothetical protein [Candidatus Limnocylindrales bacterium]